MGLSGWVHTVGWYLEILMIMIWPVIVMSLAMCYGQITTRSDPTLIFVFLREYISYPQILMT